MKQSNKVDLSAIIGKFTKLKSKAIKFEEQQTLKTYLD